VRSGSWGAEDGRAGISQVWRGGGWGKKTHSSKKRGGVYDQKAEVDLTTVSNLRTNRYEKWPFLVDGTTYSSGGREGKNRDETVTLMGARRGA